MTWQKKVISCQLLGPILKTSLCNLFAFVLFLPHHQSNFSDLAHIQPILLLFAEEYIRQAKAKSLSLVTEVSGFILNRENNLLINHNVRDELLSKVRTELQLINGYMLTIKNSMYWAKMNGVIKKLNPYQAYINQDISLVNRILIQKEILER